MDCAEAAAGRLGELVAGHEVDCIVMETDPYGRLVSRCTVDGVDLSAALVSEGLAWEEFSDSHLTEEEAARDAQVGIWRGGAEPTTAHAFRADRWGRAVAASPNGCPIKGNIGSSGEHIYHTPWSHWYSRTKINETKGERWFCDEAEALEAGWRAPFPR